ncbi:hypothetical protein BJ165DRAFT_1480461 [Panaeolus papilionaceus]|nr:hypothetical protein BJ165DRAFT_1480461 [Panaeolus papilionaceus]
MQLYEAGPAPLSGLHLAKQSQLNELYIPVISKASRNKIDVRRVYDIARFLAALFPKLQIDNSSPTWQPIMAQHEALQHLSHFLKGCKRTGHKNERQANERGS